MQEMKDREALRKLNNRVEIDDAYLGGERSAGKTLFVAEVQTDNAGKPQLIALQIVGSFSSAEIRAFAKAMLSAGTDVYSGLHCSSH